MQDENMIIPDNNQAKEENYAALPEPVMEKHEKKQIITFSLLEQELVGIMIKVIKLVLPPGQIDASGIDEVNLGCSQISISWV